jgi:hypothetical protein
MSKMGWLALSNQHLAGFRFNTEDADADVEVLAAERQLLGGRRLNRHRQTTAMNFSFCNPG